MRLHFATCATWVTRRHSSCTCFVVQRKPWRIRKDGDGELFPWGVYRLTGTVQDAVSYERLMSCSTHRGAVDLVQSMIWLARNGVRSESV